MASSSGPGIEEMKQIVSMARQILPADIAIQVSPNLISPREMTECGASDLGGISPETIDYINPESPWPNLSDLRSMIDVPLRERLPVYPEYVKEGWYGARLKHLIIALSDAEGFRKTY
jgi:FO synthase subunit 1